MAIWQVDFKIINIEKLKLVKKYKNNKIEDIDWIGFELNSESIKSLKIILTERKSWSENLKQYGDIEKTCVELFYQNNVLLEVSCRIDVRNLIKKEIIAIIDFINSNNALILLDNMIYEASMYNIFEIIKKSNAFRFCENPEKFLQSLEKNI